MGGWPAITEPLLRERQGMSFDQFYVYLMELVEALGARELDDEQYERAISYPWMRPPGSCFVTEDGVEHLSDLGAGRRDELIREYLHESQDRVPLLAYGANGSPERLSQKLAHLPDGHREALILAGDLEDFDIAPAAQPPLFISMPATLMPSPSTLARVAVLFLDHVQFTALWWTEFGYKLGALSDVKVTTDFTQEPITRVILFMSRFGTFCHEGAPVAMAALKATNRRFTALTQVEILDAAARMSLGDGATARDLVKAAFEQPITFMAEHYAKFKAASAPFESEHWTEMPVGRA
jgi:hypothetical protein